VKLSFSTLGSPSWGLERVLDVAGREGYDGVELRFLENDDALWARPELSGSRLGETRRRLQDAGLVVSCVDTRSFFHDPEPAARARALDEASRSLELAARLGAPGIRVFGDRVQPGADLAATRGWIAEAMQALAEAGARTGVEAWIESHGDFARAADTLSILELVPSRAAGVVWDPANAFEAGEAPAEGPRVLGERIRHVHLKDLARARAAEGGTAWKPVLVGEGEFPAADVLALLHHAGYDGFVSFEWEKRWHPQIEEPEVALPRFARWAASVLRRLHDQPEAAPPRPPARGFNRGRLAVEVHPDRAALGHAAARVVAARIREMADREGRAAVIFASAPSQNEMLAALRADPAVPWRKVIAFHLDEYVGVGPRHPASFRRFLTERLFDHVPVRTFHGIDGGASDQAGECARYAGLLQRERPGLVILGVGENGHLAFIDPPVCNFAEKLDVRVVELDGPCRQQQVHDGGFARLEDVPRTAFSLTIPFIMGVPRAVAIVPGPAKRAAIGAALDGPVTAACPASILRRHSNATLFLDEESAALVERTEA
jgi:glucosamine-6-phosphate deaminase